MKKGMILSEYPPGDRSPLKDFLCGVDIPIYSVIPEYKEKKPPAKEMKAFYQEVDELIKKIQPEYCLLLGPTPAKARGLKIKLSEDRGQWIVGEDKINYMATFNPSIIFRQENKEPLLRQDFKRFIDTLQGKAEIDTMELNWKLVTSIDELNECIEDLEKAKWIEYDLETTGLEWWREEADIVLMALATKDTQWLIPFNHPQSPFKKPKVKYTIMEVISDLLRKKKVAMHNGKFDSLWGVHKYDQEIQADFDTMLAHYILDENNPHGLKILSSLYFGAPNFDISTEEKTGGAPLKKIAKYAAADVYYTRKLRIQLAKELNEDKTTRNVFKHLIMPASRALVKTQHHGVYVRRDQMETTLRLLKEDQEEILSKLNEVKEGVNWNSTKQLGQVLFGDLGIQPIDFTKGGAPSTSESVLKQLRDQSEVPELVLKFREISKLMQFIESWEEKMDENNRLHPTFQLHRTVTGRLSCKDPNLQQVPRDKRVRSLIGAPEGWTFIEADYSQVELRVAAMISGDREMKRVFQTGQDIHTNTAQLLTGKANPEKEERKSAKAVNFGFLYGMSWKKFKDYARDKYGVILTDNEAKMFRRRFFDRYKDLPRWYERQQRIVEQQGYIRTLIGRKRRLPEIWSSDDGKRAQAIRQSINTPVQSFASDMALASMVEIDQKIPKSQCVPVGLVHDALLFEVRTDSLDEVLPQIKGIMEHPEILDLFNIHLTVPIIAEVSVGNWGAGIDWTG